MTTEDNIFKNGGEFYQRGDETKTPVDWHFFIKKNQVMYIDGDGDSVWLYLDGKFNPSRKPSRYDLLPVPRPQKIVAWESIDDVPEEIRWLRYNGETDVIAVQEITTEGLTFRGVHWLFNDLAGLSWHSNWKAKDGWKPCGKYVDQ